MPLVAALQGRDICSGLISALQYLDHVDGAISTQLRRFLAAADRASRRAADQTSEQGLNQGRVEVDGVSIEDLGLDWSLPGRPEVWLLPTPGPAPRSASSRPTLHTGVNGLENAATATVEVEVEDLDGPDTRLWVARVVQTTLRDSVEVFLDAFRRGARWAPRNTTANSITTHHHPPPHDLTADPTPPYHILASLVADPRCLAVLSPHECAAIVGGEVRYGSTQSHHHICHITALPENDLKNTTSSHGSRR